MCSDKRIKYRLHKYSVIIYITCNDCDKLGSLLVYYSVICWCSSVTCNSSDAFPYLCQTDVLSHFIFLYKPVPRTLWILEVIYILNRLTTLIENETIHLFGTCSPGVVWFSLERSAGVRTLLEFACIYHLYMPDRKVVNSKRILC